MRLRNLIFLGCLGAMLVTGYVFQGSANERANRLINKLETGQPVIGVLAGAMAAPRIAKVLGTSDVDFILADLEHEVHDYQTLRNFVLGLEDFSQRFRAEARPAPSVLVKLGHRAGWDARYEVAEVLKIAPAAGICVPFVESRADLEKVISAVRHVETTALAGMNVPEEIREPWPLDPKGELFVVAMIESEEGVRHAREIVETPGVGAIWAVHVSDEALASILKMCKETGVKVLIGASPEDIKSKVEAGYQMLIVGWDFQLLEKELKETVEKMRSVLN
ncbi:aldolase/citrate lyase family protein [Acidobacteriota bacterium]